MPRIHFHLQLAELKDKLLAMAALAQQAVEASVDAYLQRDQGLCQYVKQNETAINTAELELDEMAYELLAKEQPMAIDLRFILAVIKINGDLERVGDQAVNIAQRALDIGLVVMEWIGDDKDGSSLSITGLQTLTVDGDGSQAEIPVGDVIAGAFVIPVYYTARIT